ncbi:hypothetical protein FRX31_009590 [Thalictrum thalictroides]|uniref:Reverse transcriptase zinc-binding domain-containing protein n=1 Tax=Thalictrum thalictroides TaxID=46969 RepID=A0A7J6WUU8_THATH|nr:hypothetical protein FRX31_009590 [Thalictrum thalictroides]
MEKELLEDYKLLRKSISQDKRIWPFNCDRIFTIKSFIQQSTDTHNPSKIFRRIWQISIPSKISFFSWKLLLDAIPVDEALARCHISIASKCLCCTTSSEESLIHLFVTSEWARRILLYFNDIFEQRPPSAPNIKLILASWFSVGKKGSMEFTVFSLTPLAILWEIWKERCSRKYDDTYVWSLTPVSLIISKVKQ